MRILFLPVGANRTVLHCQRLLAPLVRTKPRIDDRIAAKAAKTWSSFQVSKVRWKQTIVKYANKALDTIPFEERALKTVPPFNTWMREHAVSRRHIPPAVAEVKDVDLAPISVVYPARCFKNWEEAEGEMRRLALTGIKVHKRQMIWCAIGLPLTLPCALIPVIPNIPGFYVLFRLWCNWKAWQGARHLLHLIDDRHLVPSHLAALDATYSDAKQIITQAQIKRLEDIFKSWHLTSELEQARRQILAESKPT